MLVSCVVPLLDCLGLCLTALATACLPCLTVATMRVQEMALVGMLSYLAYLAAELSGLSGEESWHCAVVMIVLVLRRTLTTQQDGH